MARPSAGARIASVAFLVVGPLVATVTQASPGRGRWSAVTAAAPGPARVIGRSGGACLAGAAPLPLEGAGYQAVDPSRRRYYGHPILLDYVTALGQRVDRARLGTMLVGDMAQPRGGPMSFGHVSHQGGLDVDLWFRLDVAPLPRQRREGIPQPSVLDPATGRPDPARWDGRHAQLIHLAASDPRVSRVFVGAAIKRDLCERSWPDRSWLRVVRPWHGHDDHLHVRLRCPADSPACVDQPSLPLDEGCGAAELAAAIARERARAHRTPPEPNQILPAACQALLAPVDSPAPTVQLASGVIKLQGEVGEDRSGGGSSKMGGRDADRGGDRHDGRSAGGRPGRLAGR